MTESPLTRQIQVSLTNADTRIWRNNVGTAWQGRIKRNRNGSMTIIDPRPVHFGLCEGSSDLIGLTSVLVTPELVGHRLAVFCAVEVKTPNGYTDPSRLEQQRNFIAMVQALGGNAGFATSIEEAREAIAKGSARS